MPEDEDDDGASPEATAEDDDFERVRLNLLPLLAVELCHQFFFVRETSSSSLSPSIFLSRKADSDVG